MHATFQRSPKCRRATGKTRHADRTPAAGHERAGAAAARRRPTVVQIDAAGPPSMPSNTSVTASEKRIARPSISTSSGFDGPRGVRHAVREQHPRARLPVGRAGLLRFVDRCPRQRAERVAPEPVQVAPVRAVREQERQQVRVAAEHRVIQRARVPVAAARGDRPAQFDHDLHRVARTPCGGVRQQPQPFSGQRAGQFGMPRLDAPRIVGVGARAGRHERVRRVERLLRAGGTQQGRDVEQPGLHRQPVRTDACRRLRAGIGAGRQQRGDVARRAAHADRPQQRCAPGLRQPRAGRLVRVAAMREQQFERVGIAHVERAPQRIRPAHPRAVFEQHARAGRMLHRVIQRFAVVRVGAGFQQHRGENRIAIDARRAVQRRQRPRFVGFGERRRRKAVADPLVRIGAGIEQKTRAGAQPGGELGKLPEPRMRDGDERRQLQRAAGARDPAGIGGQRRLHGVEVAGRARDGRIVRDEIGMVEQQLRGDARPGRVDATGHVAAVRQVEPAPNQPRALLPRQRMRFDERAEIGP